MAPRLPSIPFDGAEPPCITAGCSRCCHDTEMLLSNDDVLRLSLERPGEDFWFQADDGYLQLKTRDGPAAAGARHPDQKPCWFLGDDGHCTVHEARPEGCRLYPAVWDVDLGRARLDDEECPHTDGFRLTRFIGPAVAALAKRLQAERGGRRPPSSQQA